METRQLRFAAFGPCHKIEVINGEFYVMHAVGLRSDDYVQLKMIQSFQPCSRSGLEEAFGGELIRHLLATGR